MAGGELVEVVDRLATVERIVSRAEMRRHNLRHRATYIVVLSSRGELLCHQRAAWKDIWPSRWDLAFGGVCAVGEAWRTAAQRELAEEAGLDVTLDALVERGPVIYDSDDTRVVGCHFEVVHDGPFRFADGEVVAAEWVPLAGLGSWVAAHELCADSATVIVPRYI